MTWTQVHVDKHLIVIQFRILRIKENYEPPVKLLAPF
jgi:hypothetical protein